MTRRLNSAALSTLRFFEVAARLQSVSRAAAEFRVTQGAVSQHIKALEDRLGCKLFFRLPGQIKLTDDGRRFAEVTTRALQELEASAEMLVTPGKSITTVRLRADRSFALRWLIPRLGRLHTRHPNIKLQLKDTQHCPDPARRDFDLAIGLGQTPPSGLHAELLLEEYLTPVCSPQYLSCHPFLRAPANLARCTLLHDERASRSVTEDTEWHYWLKHAGAPLMCSARSQFFTSTDMVIEAALAHQGVALGHLSLLEAPLSARTLVAPIPQRIVSSTRYYLAYRRDLPDCPALQHLVNWLHDEVATTNQACVRTPDSTMGIKGYTHPSGNIYSIADSRRALQRPKPPAARVTTL